MKNFKFEHLVESIFDNLEEKKAKLPSIDELIETYTGDKLAGGMGDKTDPLTLNNRQLEMGLKVELEHTADPEFAFEIAVDHLTEIEDYYTRLAAMEKEAKEEQKEKKTDTKSRALLNKGKDEDKEDEDEAEEESEDSDASEDADGGEAGGAEGGDGGSAE